MAALAGWLIAARRRYPLWQQLAALQSIVLLVVLGVLGAALYLQVGRYVFAADERRLRDQVDIVMARHFPRPGTTGGPRAQPAPFCCPTLEDDTDLAALGTLLVREVSTRDITALFATPDGTVLTQADGPPHSPTIAADHLAALQALVAGERPLRRPPAFVSETDGEPWMLHLVPFQAASAEPGQAPQLRAVLQVAVPRRRSEDLLTYVRLLVLGGGGVGLALGISGILLATRALLRPIEQVARAAEHVAQTTDLGHRLQLGPGRNEVHVLAAAFDRMLDRLEAAFAAQRRFVADASHELRSPLTAIGGMAEVLSLGADQGDAALTRKASRGIEREVDRLGRLVGDLLTLSRLDEAPPPRRGVVQLADTLRDVADHTRIIAPGRTISVHLPEDDRALLLAGDPDQLKQVFLNLADNAAKFTPPGGAISFVATASGHEMAVSVTDTGPGIHPDDLPRIFDRFYRGDPSRARGTGGSGLGLSIAEAVMAAHGGKIEVVSAPDQGTTVTVILPRYTVLETGDALT